MVISKADRIILTGKLIKHKAAFEKKLILALKDNNVTATLQFSELSDRAVKGAALRAVNKSINSLFI